MKKLGDNEIIARVLDAEHGSEVNNVSRECGPDGRVRIFINITCRNGHTEKRLYDNIIRGHGCKTCAREQHQEICERHFQKYSKADIKNYITSHDYVWVNEDEYVNAASIIVHKCNKCGNVSRSNVTNLFSGRECRQCGIYHKKDTDEFREYAAHTDEGYELMSEYVSCKERVLMKHSSCGTVFEMTPDSFMNNGSRCPHCMSSHGELAIQNELNKLGVKYLREYRFDGCKYKRSLPFDFYIPSLNTCIEYNGQQHYYAVDYYGGEERLNYRKNNDEIKAKYCKENGINLVTIPYWEFNNIGGLINGIVTTAE